MSILQLFFNQKLYCVLCAVLLSSELSVYHLALLKVTPLSIATIFVLCSLFENRLSIYRLSNFNHVLKTQKRKININQLNKHSTTAY